MACRGVLSVSWPASPGGQVRGGQEARYVVARRLGYRGLMVTCVGLRHTLKVGTRNEVKRWVGHVAEGVLKGR